MDWIRTAEASALFLSGIGIGFWWGVHDCRIQLGERCDAIASKIKEKIPESDQPAELEACAFAIEQLADGIREKAF